MKAIVTGGAGFIGSHIADVLTERGYAVTVFDVRPSPHLQANQTMVIGDILDAQAVTQAIDGSDYVFHLAGFADLNAARTQPLKTAQVNLLGTLHMLEAARAAAVKRFVFASTVYVYSREGGFYRCSKQACETYIEEYHCRYGLEYCVLRYGSLYGPRSNESNGVYRLLRSAATTGRLQYAGTPDDVREYIHVTDAARVSVDALADEYANQHLVITGHYPRRIRDLFTMFSEILGREIDAEYLNAESHCEDGHYRITPYAFDPKVGRKLTTSNCYVDMGQGLLQLLHQLHEDGVLTAGSTSSSGGDD